METIVFNLSGKVRRASLHGRQYLVAPCTLIVPGVLNGSRGPLYYPAEEISQNVDAWNHMPLVVYHPNSNGEHISARRPDVLNEQGVGFLFNAHIARNGALKGEAWFDVEATERIDPRVLISLNSGKKIELSTGLYTTNHPKPGVYNGRNYDYVARSYKPDHLAVLPDQIGACSLKDGCGILVNQSSRWTMETNDDEDLDAILDEFLSEETIENTWSPEARAAAAAARSRGGGARSKVGKSKVYGARIAKAMGGKLLSTKADKTYAPRGQVIYTHTIAVSNPASAAAKLSGKVKGKFGPNGKKTAGIPVDAGSGKHTVTVGDKQATHSFHFVKNSTVITNQQPEWTQMETNDDEIKDELDLAVEEFMDGIEWEPAENTWSPEARAAAAAARANGGHYGGRVAKALGGKHLKSFTTKRQASNPSSQIIFGKGVFTQHEHHIKVANPEAAAKKLESKLRKQSKGFVSVVSRSNNGDWKKGITSKSHEITVTRKGQAHRFTFFPTNPKAYHSQNSTVTNQESEWRELVCNCQTHNEEDEDLEDLDQIVSEFFLDDEQVDNTWSPEARAAAAAARHGGGGRAKTYGKRIAKALGGTHLSTATHERKAFAHLPAATVYQHKIGHSNPSAAAMKLQLKMGGKVEFQGKHTFALRISDNKKKPTIHSFAFVKNSTTENASADSSLEERREEVREAFYMAYPNKYDPKTGRLIQSPCLIATFDDYFIFCMGDMPNDPYSSMPMDMDDDLYKQAYTTDSEGEVTLKGKPTKVEKVVTYVSIANSVGGIHVAKLSVEERKAVIDDLVANCDCWKNEGDEEVLNAMNDDRLILAKKQADEYQRATVVANKAANGFELDGRKVRVNPENGKWESQGKPKKPAPVVNADPEEEEEEDDTPPPPPRRRTENRAPRTDDEAIRMLPPHLQEKFAQAQQIENDEKKKVVEQILANSDLTHDQRYRQADRLMKKELNDLRDDLALMPKKQSVANSPAAKPAEIQVDNYEPDDDGDGDALGLPPTSAWNNLEDEEGEPVAGSKGKTRVINRHEQDVELDSLPPKARRELMEYRRIVANEKQQLIQQLSANFLDDEEEERLYVNRLNTYGIEVLRDMAKALPKAQQRNYFGSQGAPTTIAMNRGSGGGGRTSNAEDDNDVLLPPESTYEARKQA